jgi:FkbM family methyltransferase
MDGMIGAYFNSKFLEHIDPDKIKVILELGSRDGIDALKLSEFYDADVYAFECNPHAVADCVSMVGDNNRVEIINKAVWSENTTIPFYPVVNGNDGASSCFVANPVYPYERYDQIKVEVEAIRLRDWIDLTGVEPDMLCIDLQGAEEHALMGMGTYLKNVKYVITEGQVSQMYHGASTIFDIELLLDECGFVMKHNEPVNEWFGDYLFVKEDE